MNFREFLNSKAEREMCSKDKEEKNKIMTDFFKQA